MKKVSCLLILFVLSASFAFSTVRDNSISDKDGSSTVGATIIKPLQIMDAGTIFLGEFVKSTTPYNPNFDVFDGTTLDFIIEGEPYHEFFYKIVPDFDGNSDGAVASIELSSPGPASGGFGGGFSSAGEPILGETSFSDYLDEFGSFLIQLQVSSLTAIGSGTDDFVQTVYVSYTSF